MPIPQFLTVGRPGSRWNVMPSDQIRLWILPIRLSFYQGACKPVHRMVTWYKNLQKCRARDMFLDKKSMGFLVFSTLIVK
jgi:hypothetical protein